MRPFHEIMRLAGLEEGAGVPEPGRVDPMALAHLGNTLYRCGRTMAEVEEGLEIFCREENVKPAVLMAAVREVEITAIGQPMAFIPRRLIAKGRISKDVAVLSFPNKPQVPFWHPCMG